MPLLFPERPGRLASNVTPFLIESSSQFPLGRARSAHEPALRPKRHYFRPVHP
jgi:hypothetical protein